MSNQFYSYLSCKIIDFCRSGEINSGDRFYIEFDQKNDSLELFNELSKNASKEKFHIYNEYYFNAHVFKAQGLKFILVQSLESITPDFLVTLRNKVSEQDIGWEKTCLLFVLYETLDSIRFGSKDLSSNGFPLNFESIKEDIKSSLDTDEISISDISVLKYELSLKNTDKYIKGSLFDYKDILSCVQKKKIEVDDFEKFGMFVDDGLCEIEEISAKNERIKLNKELFNYFQTAYDTEDFKYLDKLIGFGKKDEINKNNWKDTSFRKIQNWVNENKNDLVKLSLLKVEFSYESKIDFKYSAKSTNELSVIIFTQIEKGILTITFDNKLQNAIISSGKNVKFEHRINDFSIEIDIDNTNSFYYIDFQDTKYKNSRFQINVLVLNLNDSIFSNILNRMFVNAKEKLVKIDGFKNLMIGENIYSQNENIIEKENQTLYFNSETDNNLITLDEQLSSLEELKFNINFDDRTKIQFKLVDITNSVKTITTLYELDVDIRISKTSFNYNIETKNIFSVNSNFKVLSENIQKQLELECLFLRKQCTNFDDENACHLNLPSDLRDKYNDIIDYFNLHHTIPSLAYVNEELESKYIAYISTYMKSLSEIENGHILSREVKNMSILGTVYKNNRVEISPFHPLIIAHKLVVLKELGNDIVDTEILKKLNPNNFLPYIYGPNNLCLECSNNPELPSWIFYNPIGRFNSTEENLYTSNLVFDKIKQFKLHFDNLFLNEPDCPILINLIDITNDQDILIGILKYLISEMNEKGSFDSINSINVKIYGNSEKSSFDTLSQINNIDEFDPLIYREIINSKTSNIDLIDILNTFQKKIFFYKYNNESYDYAHMTFVKLITSTEFRKNKLEDFESGFQLNGSINTLSSIADNEDYRISIGKLNSIETEFSSFVLKINEFYANMIMYGDNSYEKDSVLTTTISSKQVEKMDRIYNSSNWVSFINPEVDFSFFKKTHNDLLIIHYSDQLTSFKKFDSITVTNKVNQYTQILKQYLNGFSKEINDKNIENAIKSFNCVNGEWLLQSLVNDNKGMIFGKEKLSILSAIKYTLSIIDAEDILWVPISLEEIVRVTRASKLETLKSAFSVKNLNENGIMSDDLLLFGFHRINNKIECYLYPIEVKIGYVKSDTVRKAREQVKSILNIIKKHIINNETFEGKYYKNLFLQLALSNLELMNANNFWNQKIFTFSEKDIVKFAKGEFDFNFRLSEYIGEGGIVTFRKEENYNKITLQDNIMHISLTEAQGYKGIYKELNKLNSEIHNGDTDFDSNYLLKNRIERIKIDNNIVQEINHSSTTSEVNLKNLTLKQEEKVDLHEIKNVLENQAVVSDKNIEIEKEENLLDLRVLIGKVVGSNHELFWEFGHKQLPNRHMLISGASGQGKTYLIQCLLLELSKKEISSIIFDYTQGFTLDKLETEFVEKMEGKIKEEVIFIDKISVNPFKKQKIYADYDESSIQIAQRITDIFSHVYELGDQQKSMLYQACKIGIEKYGDNMSMKYLESELETLDTKESKSVLSKFKPFFDLDFFKSDSIFDWKDIIYSKGKVNIIQLMNINSLMQTIITELILWDIWYFVQKVGNENNPFVAVLDESQNLSFEKDSPASKILTEGRKFGWSTLFATQFLKGQLKQDEISRLLNANQKLYFLPPQNEIQDISSRISNESEVRKDIEAQLRQLEKGKCLFDGLQLSGGSLRKINPVIVQISSLSNRKK